ncbi:MAG: restriction endonuclease subunit S [Methylococcales bacterium]|nr:restriction endonuclease subunit S [Methylococcales bacterium]
MNLKTNMPKIDLNAQDWNEVCHILKIHLPDYPVWAFGSRVKWTAKAYSDLDLAIITLQPLSLSAMATIKEAFDESNLSIRVDIVDWAATSEEFRKIIERNKVILQKGKEGREAIGSDWILTSIDELKASTPGSIAIGPFGSRMKSDCYVPIGVRVVRGTNLMEGRKFSGEFVFITENKAKELGNSNLQPNDIVFPHRGSIGEVGIVPDDGKQYVISSSLMKLSCDTSKAAPLFIYYFFKSSLGRFELLKNASQVGTPGIGQPLTSLKAIRLRLPPINEQLGIVGILASLDDRIALLRETNATLEAIAQALFKSWFVDFDPVHAKQQGREPEGMDADTAALFPDSFEESELGLVPKGWLASTLDEISTVGIGKTPPRKEQHWFSENPNDVRWVSIRDMGICGAYISTTNEFLKAESIERFNVRLVPDNTVMLSFKMTIGRVAISDGEMTTNEAIAHFKLDEQAILSTEFIYLHLKHFDYSTLSSTSSIADAVNSKTVKNIPIVVPSLEVFAVFQNQVSIFFQKIKVIEHQAHTLTTLRDTLLPRLISGQLRLSDAEVK